jgi:hypothetical protein
MTEWLVSRFGLGGLALTAAALTGVLVVQIGGMDWHAHGATAYFLIALLASVSPAAIAAQVVTGQLLVGSLLLTPGGSPSLLLVPAISGVILTAELLSIMARMDTPFASHPRSDLRRAGLSVLIGAGVFGAVLLASPLPGPGGLLAVVMAAGACVGLAVLLANWAG